MERQTTFAKTGQVPQQWHVIDADGLNALPGYPAPLSSRAAPPITSPHPGEMSRLTGMPIPDIEKRREKIAADSAKEWGVEIILKGAPSLVAATDGALFVNTTGNPGMSTAGSGDVLTGVITAMLCQGLPPLAAARLAVHVHGLAGDLAAAQLGQVGMIASDLLDFLPKAFLEMASSP